MMELLLASILAQVVGGGVVMSGGVAISTNRNNTVQISYDWGPLGHVFTVAANPWTDYRDRCVITLQPNFFYADSCQLAGNVNPSEAYWYLQDHFPRLHLEAPSESMTARCLHNTADAPYACPDYPYIPIGCEDFPAWMLMVCHI